MLTKRKALNSIWCASTSRKLAKFYARKTVNSCNKNYKNDKFNLKKEVKDVFNKLIISNVLR